MDGLVSPLFCGVDPLPREDMEKLVLPLSSARVSRVGVDPFTSPSAAPHLSRRIIEL